MNKNTAKDKPLDFFDRIKGNKILAGISDIELENIDGNVIYQLKRYKSDDVVALMDDEVAGQYFLTKGTIKAEMTDPDARSLKIDELHAPALIAPAFIFAGRNRFPVNVIAKTEIEIVFVHKTHLLSLLQSNQQILKNYLTIVSSRAQFLSQKIKFLSFQTIKGKYASYLIDNVVDGNTNLMLKESHEALSAIFGVTRPSLSRAVRELDQDKIIVARGKNVKILDLPKLKQYVR
ncbi:MAG: Crp/Fnr family transcriptional regulator [Bacteroidales bacterium]